VTEAMTARGRPKSPEKGQAILSAAAECFMTIGFSASMEQIASAGQVSKQTLYSHFANKHELFNAVVRNKMNLYFGESDSLPRSQGLREELLDRGERVLNMMADPGVGCMIRCVAAQVETMPDIAEDFWQSGPTALCSHIQSTFARHQDPAQAETLAWRFVYALAGPVMFSNMMGQPSPINADRQHLESVVDMFAPA